MTALSDKTVHLVRAGHNAELIWLACSPIVNEDWDGALKSFLSLSSFSKKVEVYLSTQGSLKDAATPHKIWDMIYSSMKADFPYGALYYLHVCTSTQIGSSTLIAVKLQKVNDWKTKVNFLPFKP